MSLEDAINTLAHTIGRLADAVQGAKALPQSAIDAAKVVAADTKSKPKAEPAPEVKPEPKVEPTPEVNPEPAPAASTEFPLDQLSARVQEALRAKKGPQAAEILRDIGQGAVKASAVPAHLRKQVFDAIGRVLEEGK